MAHLETATLLVSANGTLPNVPFLALKNMVLGKQYQLSIAFVPPITAQAINIERRAKDYIPNTLSFSLSEDSGEIIMCRSAIKAQYKSFDMDYRTYTIFLLIHSMLHLKGYDHGEIMEQQEQLFLKKVLKLG